MPPTDNPPVTSATQQGQEFAMLKRMARLEAAIEPTIFQAPAVYTADEFAKRVGLSPQEMKDLALSIGQPLLVSPQKRYTEAHVDAVGKALLFAEAEGLTPDELVSLVRSMSAAMERLAARQVEAIVQKIATSEQVNDTEARLRTAERMPRQVNLLLPLLAHVYRRYFSNSLRRLTVDAITQRGFNNNDADYPLVRAIGFADLVDFTSRIEHASPTELSDLIRTFQAISWDIVHNNRGRVVNFIGDQVFFVADTLTDGANIALQLAAPGALGKCGEARVGLGWCRVITTEGDVFGPGVNLTARICAAAAPGEVFIDPKAARLLQNEPGYTVEAQPVIEARGIGSVTPSRLSYTNSQEI